MTSHIEALGRAPSHTDCMPTAKPGSVPAFECHIFLGPLNPSPDTLAKYQQAVADYNEHYAGADMKAPFLGLQFRSSPTSPDATTVSVMQSARHVHTSALADACAQLRRDAEWFAARDFEVLRAKLECCSGNLTADAARACWSSAGYYEAHVRVCSKDGRSERMTDDAKQTLDAVALRLTTEFGTPVPLSFNLNHDASGDYQRYLNVRAERLDEFEQRVAKLLAAIRDDIPELRVMKSIKELVVADSYRQLDCGWIDFREKAAA